MEELRCIRTHSNPQQPLDGYTARRQVMVRSLRVLIAFLGLLASPGETVAQAFFIYNGGPLTGAVSGTWRGTWQSDQGPSGELRVTFTQTGNAVGVGVVALDFFIIGNPAASGNGTGTIQPNGSL